MLYFEFTTTMDDITAYVRLICRVFHQHTLETALLSASQEIEMGSDNPAAMQSIIQQRDLLQNGLLSTCRELSRITAVSHAPYSHTHIHTHAGLCCCLP